MRSVSGHTSRFAVVLVAAISLGCIPNGEEGEDVVDATAADTTAEPAVRLEQPKDRREAEEQLVSAKAAFEANENDATRRIYAQALFRVGDIRDAAQTIGPLLTDDSQVVIDLLVGAQAALYTFDLDKAERLFERILAIAEEGSEDLDDARLGLAMVYYHSQQFDKAQKLPKWKDETDENQSIVTFMQRFEGVPYEIEWASPDKTGHIPFVNDIREPGVLPISKIVINGVEFEFILDTGGDRLYLDQSLLDKSGVSVVGTTQNKYAYTGGEMVDENYAVADTVEFDGVTIRNVPIHTSPLKARGVEADGIITTGLLKQFLSTVDYDNNEITLRERSQEARNDLLAGISNDGGVIGMPFIMAASHLMFAKGTVNDRSGMNMFMDSGLAMSMPGIVANETADLFELEKSDIEGTNYYWTSLDQFGLNNVQHGAGNAVGNVFVDDDLYWRLGFSFDALLSHQYLWPLGSWTIDFDEMAFYFPGKAAHVDETAGAEEPAKTKILVENAEQYVGSYEIAPGVALELTARDGVVYLQAPGQQPIGMEAYHDGTFGIPLAGATIVFQGDPESGITGLEMTQGANVTAAEKK